MKEKLYRFMAGRNGMDRLGMLNSAAALVLILINVFLKSALVEVLIAASLAVYCFRILSRNIPARRRENEAYLQLRFRVTGAFASLRDRWRQRKDFAFFRCPGCKAMLRVPRGKGRLRVTCRKCGNIFEKKT